ncbi:MAG: serine/threonine protein kinase [Thermoanaerobaculia bacterium]|nr:serine/threonine protein kinase [Thermoanaerobaculia bacterium]
MRPTLRIGLLGRILLALLAVGVLPLGLASIGLVGMNRDAMTEQVLRTHTVAARSAAVRIASFLESRRMLAEAVASGVASGGATGETSQAVLAGLLSSDLGIVAAVVEDDQGTEVVRVQNKRFSGSVDEALALRVAGSWTVFETKQGAWFRLDVTLPGEIGRLHLIGDLMPVVAALDPRVLGRQTVLILADTEGRQVLGLGRVEDFPSAMVETATTGKVFGAGRFGEGAQTVIGAYAKVSGTDWVVLSRQSGDVAEATTHTLARRSLVAVSLAIALMLVVAWWSQRSLIDPLRAVIRSQEALAGMEGERPERVGTEIDQLRRSFATLAERLRLKEELGEIFLGRYQVLDVLGEGAMGTVFRGWDPDLRRPLALKTVRLDREAGEERIQLARQLLAEAVHVARVSHPNIVAVHDVQASGEVAFLALELVAGGTLEELLNERHVLSASEVVHLGRCLARGLGAAHQEGIVHHDIKPGNILLSSEGAIKIADFGVSQLLEGVTEAAETVVGTPGYIAPEALHGQGYSPQGDLFALGVVLYQATTGHRPFVGETVREILLDTANREPKAPSEWVAATPVGLEDILSKLLRKDPLRRYRSALEVERDLDVLVDTLGDVWCVEVSRRIRTLDQEPTAALVTRSLAG